MFSRNRTRVTALQEQCNMADVGRQKCLHGNTPQCALGLYGSELSTSIDLQYWGINIGKCLSKAVNLREIVPC